MQSSPILRALLGFLAAVLSVLTFHQAMIGLLHAAGMLPRPPFNFAPVPPLGVPVLLNLCFWGGLYGILFGLVLPRLPRALPLLAAGLLLGLLAASVGWFVVAPIKGLPMAAGWSGQRMLVSVLINGVWGIGTAVILRGIAGGAMAAARAA